MFQLVDPQLTQSSQPSEVDFSNPPSDVVATSVTKLQRLDYSYEVVVASNESRMNGSSRLVKRFRVEHSDGEYIAYGPFGTNGTKIYANDAIAWVRPSSDADWQVNTQSKYAYPATGELNPFDVSSITETDGTVLNETEMRMVIRINATTTKGIDVAGYTLFYVDKRSGNLQKAVEVGQYDGEKAVKTVRFSEVGTTTVKRPDGIGFSVVELVGDLVRYTPT
ncbi:hypothetical protein [Haladaptatus sp. NG-SE-30]